MKFSFPSAPFRFATLTFTTRWEKNPERNDNNTTTNIHIKVPNLFQDLTFASIFLPFGCGLPGWANSLDLGRACTVTKVC